MFDVLGVKRNRRTVRTTGLAGGTGFVNGSTKKTKKREKRAVDGGVTESFGVSGQLDPAPRLRGLGANFRQ